MKIVISEETKEKFDCLKQWENWYFGAWVISLIYSIGYFFLFSIPQIYLCGISYSFNVLNIFTDVFVVTVLICISLPVIVFVESRIIWWREHYKYGVLTL